VELQRKLDGLAQTDSTYLAKLDVTVNNMSLSELIRNIAEANEVNINYQGDESKRMTCNFRQISLVTFLYFVCQEQQLDAEVVGNILSLYPYRPPVAEPELKLTYDSISQRFSFDFTGVQLIHLARCCGEASGVNLIVPQSLYGYRVSGYGKELGVEDALQAIAATNGLVIEQKGDASWSVNREAKSERNPAQGGHDFGGQTGMANVTVVPMQYRTVEKITDVIPTELKKGVEIITYPDMNSLVLSGDAGGVKRITTFLAEIDKSVPLVSIDVIIVDVTDNTSREAGISMGKGAEVVTSTGSLSPGIDVTLGAATVNRLLHSFNGFASTNLGKVSPNFYLSLKFLEESGKINLRSTPRLSTLNGHKAMLKSGETEYYKEVQTSIIGSQSPMQTESFQWKNVEANLSLDITPYVSLDSCITMTIDLSQSEFTDRQAADAPPGTTTRSFNSIIKVRNQEVVLLGGIERNLSSRTSKGLPFLSRIPILRWIFGTSAKKNTVQKLNVFIKPTIVS
jgi:type IV pilus assembly protein PilQ